MLSCSTRLNKSSFNFKGFYLNDGIEPSKRYSLISLLFILKCLWKTLVIRILKNSRSFVDKSSVKLEAPVQSSRHTFAMIRYRKNTCTKAKFERKRLSPFTFHLERTQLGLK